MGILTISSGWLHGLVWHMWASGTINCWAENKQFSNALMTISDKQKKERVGKNNEK